MPCTVGWGFDPAIGMELCKQAVEANFWPLFEVVDGEYKLTYKPKEDRPLMEPWLKQQVRFKHLFKPGNEGMLVEIQRWVDSEFNKIMKLCGEA